MSISEASRCLENETLIPSGVGGEVLLQNGPSSRSVLR